MENKVRFNLYKVHYAVMTDPNGEYDTPVAVPGAVSLDLSAEGETTQFHADGIRYYTAIGNAGYNGDLTMARMPEKMLEDVWGMTLHATDKVLIENANDTQKTIALLFAIDGDVTNELYVLYNCTCSRPKIGSNTNTNTKTPETQAITISASALPDGKIKACTTADTPSDVKSKWFTKVYMPAETV